MTADLVLRNGHVFCGDAVRSKAVAVAVAVAVSRGRITAVGGWPEVSDVTGPKAEKRRQTP